MGKNRYSAVAHYTKDLVYERLGPGVLEEMETRNPKNEKGNRKAAHHQWLSEDLGIPKLQEHFAAVLALQKAHDNWDDFYKAMNPAVPKKTEMPLFDFAETRDADPKRLTFST
jgi:P63C domain